MKNAALATIAAIKKDPPGTRFLLELLASVSPDHKYFDPGYVKPNKSKLPVVSGLVSSFSIDPSLISSLPDQTRGRNTVSRAMVKKIDKEKDKLAKIDARIAAMQKKRQ